MPIHQLTAVSMAPGTVQEQIGFVLYTACNNHFINFLGQVDIGLGYDSCCAVVAVDLTAHANQAQYAPIPPWPFSGVFGSSRLFKGLDPDVAPGAAAEVRTFSSSLLEEHAEQTAIGTAHNLGLPFYHDGTGNCHVYVDFNPCPLCFQWLQNRPENWWVHYHSNLAAVQRPIINVRKKKRKDAFGRIQERRRKMDMLGIRPKITKLKG